MDLEEYLAWLASGNAIKHGPTAGAGTYTKPTPVAGSIFDDFDGSAGSSPNPALWTPIVGESGGQSVSAAGNVTLDGNGNLMLTAQKSGSAEWTSAIVQSAVTMEYGTYYASMQTPVGTGIHTTFWTLGQSHVWGDAGTWPSCGETDIFEHVDDGKYYSTVHGPMYQPPTVTSHNQSQVQGSLGFNPALGFHLYWATKLKGHAVHFGIDNTELGAIGQASIPQGAPWELEVLQNVIFSVTVDAQGDNPLDPFNQGPNSNTPNPTSMLVDWFYFLPDPNA